MAEDSNGRKIENSHRRFVLIRELMICIDKIRCPKEDNLEINLTET